MMRKLCISILTGVAAVALAGVALAAGHDLHQMKVDLPDGSVAQIEYQGDVAPKVSVTPASPFVPMALFHPFDAVAFDGLDRVAEQMDRQASALLRQVRTLPASPLSTNAKLDLAEFGKLPPGTVSYSFASTSNGRATCYRSVQVTSNGVNGQPKVISNVTGNCDGADRVPSPTQLDDRREAGPPVTHASAATPAGPPHPANSV